jgi:hypothetical protein
LLYVNQLLCLDLLLNKLLLLFTLLLLERCSLRCRSTSMWLLVAALAQLLPMARAEGLEWVDLTTDPDNIPSQKVITANGGTLIRRFTKAAAYGGAESLLWRITL